MCAHIWVFYFVLLVNMSVPVLVPYGYFYCYNFIIYLEVWNDNPSSLVLFIKVVLAIEGLLWFHVNFKMFLW